MNLLKTRDIFRLQFNTQTMPLNKFSQNYTEIWGGQ